jgi:hypothetical protein
VFTETDQRSERSRERVGGEKKSEHRKAKRPKAAVVTYFAGDKVRMREEREKERLGRKQLPFNIQDASATFATILKFHIKHVPHPVSHQALSLTLLSQRERTVRKNEKKERWGRQGETVEKETKQTRQSRGFTMEAANRLQQTKDQKLSFFNSERSKMRQPERERRCGQEESLPGESECRRVKGAEVFTVRVSAEEWRKSEEEKKKKPSSISQSTSISCPTELLLFHPV